MKKNKLKIYFIDFWTHFNKKDNYFFHLLSTKYNVVVTDNNPDILFVSNFHRASDNFFDKKYKNSKKYFIQVKTHTQMMKYTMLHLH